MSDTSSSDTESIPKEIGPFDHLVNPKIPFIPYVSDSESEAEVKPKLKPKSKPKPQPKQVLQPLVQITEPEVPPQLEVEESELEEAEPPQPLVTTQSLVAAEERAEEERADDNDYYRCHKCKQKFRKQNDYIRHLGRIQPCVENRSIQAVKARIAPEYQKQLDKLEWEIKELESLVSNNRIMKKDKMKRYYKLLDTFRLFSGYTRVYALNEGDEDKFEGDLQLYLSQIQDLKTKLG